MLKRRSAANHHIRVGYQIIMVSKRREEEARRVLASEKAMSNMIEDDRTDRVCPRCAIATSLKKCPKCGGETVPMD